MGMQGEHIHVRRSAKIGGVGVRRSIPATLRANAKGWHAGLPLRPTLNVGGGLDLNLDAGRRPQIAGVPLHATFGVITPHGASD